MWYWGTDGISTEKMQLHSVVVQSTADKANLKDSDDYVLQ